MCAMVVLALDLAIKTTKHSDGTEADTEYAEVDHDFLGLQVKSCACNNNAVYKCNVQS